MLFNATRAKHSPPLSRPLEEQDERESQRLWYKTAQAVKARDHELATDEKTKIEDRQRDEAAKRAENGVEWRPKLFRPVEAGPGGRDEGDEGLDWVLNAAMSVYSLTRSSRRANMFTVMGVRPRNKQSRFWQWRLFSPGRRRAGRTQHQPKVLQQVPLPPLRKTTL